jgi:hypothetical protein
MAVLILFGLPILMGLTIAFLGVLCTLGSDRGSERKVKCNRGYYNSYTDNRSYKKINNTYNTKVINLGDYKPEKKCNYCGNAYTGLKCRDCGSGEPGRYIKNELFD